jgi:hypothetical protein
VTAEQWEFHKEGVSPLHYVCQGVRKRYGHVYLHKTNNSTQQIIANGIGIAIGVGRGQSGIGILANWLSTYSLI